MSSVDDPRPALTGWELRYFLTLAIARAGETSVRRLVDAVEAEGFRVFGRPSKTISDILRREVARGRVVRVGRGRYARGRIPRATDYRMHKRLEAFRARANSSHEDFAA